MSALPRPEHPKPQFFRKDWQNLNGEWNFAFDFGLSGLEKNWHKAPAGLDKTITVPFCPESALSGIGYTDFIPAVWYHRDFSVPADWQGKRVFLHFGAVDFECRIWVNGQEAGSHYGGSASFDFDITPFLQPGKNQLVVFARDDLRSGEQPSGKQCPEYKSFGCFYTRVTGIWQTVWLEARAQTHLKRVAVVPDLDQSRFVLIPEVDRPAGELLFRATLKGEGKEAGKIETPLTPGVPVFLPVENPRSWSPEDPFLYDLDFELIQSGAAIDQVNSYAGLRKVHVEGNRVLLNNRPVFQRLVLDQGFYPDGIWTAPSDAALKKDIELSMEAGFNGARLHQKVFEERFHYWADKLGYLTWGEAADWGRNDYGKAMGMYNLHTEWREIMLRDRNHPSIIAWTPTNETIVPARRDFETHRRVIQDLVDQTHALDPSRPVNDTSGFCHVCPDLYTVHNYEQNPEVFRGHYAGLCPEKADSFFDHHGEYSAPYAGQPFMVSEYGGTWWSQAARSLAANNDNRESWGYGEQPKSLEEVYHRIEGLTRALTDHPEMFGFTYTQLTDVEQEENGIFTYDRQPKFDLARLRACFGAPAAYESLMEAGKTG